MTSVLPTNTTFFLTPPDRPGHCDLRLLQRSYSCGPQFGTYFIQHPHTCCFVPILSSFASWTIPFPTTRMPLLPPVQEIVHHSIQITSHVTVGKARPGQRGRLGYFGQAGDNRHAAVGVIELVSLGKRVHCLDLVESGVK